MGITAAEADLLEERETPEAIDVIVNEENNDFLGVYRSHADRKSVV